MRTKHLFYCGLSAALVMLAACGDNDVSKNNDNNGTANNDATNGTTNNGTTNNDATNNDTTNNDTTNNDTTNNVDLCQDVMCTPPPATCEGAELVTFMSECNPSTGMCEGDELTRVDCATNGQICQGGECVDDDLCAMVDCIVPAPECDGTEVVTFTSMCDPANGECVSSEADRTDCATNGQVCEGGMCIDDDPTVTPGSLAVTEFMYDPTQVSDSEGEWIEIHNTTSRTLDIEGIKIKDDGTDEFVVSTGAALELGPGEYFVLGANADVMANGGAPVDMEYGGSIQLSNSSDEIVITDSADVEIDRIEYDTAGAWLDVSGASVQFSGAADAAVDDNNDATNWCAGFTPYGDGDSGTPGAANESCAKSAHTIYEISNENDPNHPAVGRGVSVADVAVTALGDSVMWIQETGGGEYSGVAVEIGAVDVSAFAAGDLVDVEGTYFEQFDRATIVLETITDTNSDAMIAPELLSTDVLGDPVTAEPWEGVLVEVVEVGVTDDAVGNGEIRLDAQLLVNDLLDPTLATTAVNCQVYESIVGVLNYSFSNHKIEPRAATDISTPVAATTATTANAAAFAFTPAALCITAGDTVTWTNMDGVGHTVTERIPTETATNDANIPTTPSFDEMLDANGGTATVTFNNAGTFHYRCRPHPGMEGVIVVPE